MSRSEAATAYQKIEDKYHFEAEVGAYDRKRFGAAGGRFLHERQLATVLDLVGPPPKKTLDAGCGTGRFTFDVARAGHEVTAVDYSAAMLDECRRRQPNEREGDRIQFRQASIFELPFDSGSFDAVVCIHVLMHLPDHEKALAELIRVVRPGGRVVFDIRNAHSLNRVSYPLRRAAERLRGRKPWYVWYCTREEIKALGRANGAEVAEVRGMFPVKPNQLPAPFLPILRAAESVGQQSLLRRVGHVQMVALEKR